jgi:hypothetical protein
MCRARIYIIIAPSPPIKLQTSNPHLPLPTLGGRGRNESIGQQHTPLCGPARIPSSFKAIAVMRCRFPVVPEGLRSYRQLQVATFCAQEVPFRPLVTNLVECCKSAREVGPQVWRHSQNYHYYYYSGVLSSPES